MVIRSYCKPVIYSVGQHALMGYYCQSLSSSKSRTPILSALSKVCSHRDDSVHLSNQALHVHVHVVYMYQKP